MKRSEYDYEDQIENNTLQITEDSYITQLSFFQYFENLEHLIIRHCPQVQPVLTSDFITELVLEHCQVRSTEQLNLPQLRELSLSNNDCQDIISLQFMQKLVKLNLSRNSLINISVLTKLLNLTDLDISKNFNVDHSPLKYMTQLIKLNAGSTNIKNSALLKTLVNLKELDLSKNIDCDISSLKYLVKLTHLNLSDTCVQDISALEPLIHLEDLNVANDFCANVFYVDITPLKNMKKLQAITSSNMQLLNTHIFNQIFSLKKLDLSKQITPLNLSQLNVEYLNMSYTEGIDLNHLQSMTALTSLHLQYCKLTNISYLAFLNLRDLDVSYNPGIDISPLEHMNSLIQLEISYCNLKVISALKNLTTLQKLGLYMNKYIDITPLQYLIQLTDLHLSNCEILEISALSPLYNLKRLDISQNQIIDISPLQKMQFTSLRFLNNRVIDLSPIKKHPNFNTYVYNYQQQPTNEDLLASNFMHQIYAWTTFIRNMPRRLKLSTQQFLTTQEKIRVAQKQMELNLQMFINKVNQLFIISQMESQQ
ncbi:leucine-rich_repeat domain-containing protein [Hexamita inflata]|uniref:Leucine-rich repeat domain-containing protein n=1 Tax=Hexamita inflata TaxID=28002 RepID=A0AA86QWT3_9EUKA|nr:leucine-rich repeat domain-containing protein [Hexamita inflata]